MSALYHVCDVGRGGEKMRIELERIHTPEELGRMVSCAICEQPFEAGVVDARLIVDESVLQGSCCAPCVAFMGRHRSGHFPPIEEYRRLEAEWGTPLYASREEVERTR